MPDPCPCGSGVPALQCCLPVIRSRSAETAEALMRSRYTAYTLGDSVYLLDTWAPETRPAQLSLDSSQRWLGLKIRRTEQGGPDDEQGTVEFVARYKVQGRGYRLHEVSRFRKIGGKWFYVDGVISPGNKEEQRSE